MCGIAGHLGARDAECLSRMIHSIRHRGPDDTGFLLRDGVGLGHARLSILDTSSAGHQPMLLPDESVAIVLNGEIYNFRDLREKLSMRGRTFVSESDTEVLLWLYKEQGEDFLRDVIGMFAIALYDFTNKKLILARDRFGEKPLYWIEQGGELLFASELRALIDSGRVPKEIDLASLNRYLQFDYVPTPDTMLRGVHKLEPATMLMHEKGVIRRKRYWTPPQHTLTMGEAEVLTKLDQHLAKSVEGQLVSDVPLGVFLSGGIDSSTIAYYAQRARSRPIDTFSIGFEDASFDESRFAREVAAYLGTNHHEEVIHSKDALDLFALLPEVLSEPVADASIIPTMLVSRFARKSVTVALGGDGGDELFAGYPTFQAEALFRNYKRLPSPLRTLCAVVINALPASHRNFPLSYNLKKFVSSDDPDTVHHHLEWLGSFAGTGRRGVAGEALHERVHKDDIFEHADLYGKEMSGNEWGNRLLYTYMRTYLMDEVLVKVDRASMHYALETRVPFLDHTLVDFMLSIPYQYKYQRGMTKYLLKKLMKGKLPSSIISRKKKGFSIPLARWLNGSLKPLCDELLSASSLGAHGLFNQKYVAELVRAHREGARDNRKELWNLMVFQLWYDRWMR